MTQTSRFTRQHQTEILILGANFSGLWMAEAFRQKGHKVTVLEESEKTGGRYVPLSSAHQNLLPSHFDFFPDQESVREIFHGFSQLLQVPFHCEAEETQLLTPFEGTLKPWVGFGDHPCASQEEIQFYTASSRLKIRPDWVSCWQTLIHEPKFDIFHRKQVTRFMGEKIQGPTNTGQETDRTSVKSFEVKGVEVNGDEIWWAQEVISTLPLRHTLKCLPVEYLEPKHRQKMAKVGIWNTFSLHLRHPQVLTQEKNIQLLMSGHQEFEPTLGQFFPSRPDGTQDSLWMTFVHPQHQEDHDYGGQLLRHIKKQIKKIYPTALENLVDEKLVLTEEAHGHLPFKFKGRPVLPELNHLWWAHSVFSSWRGPLAELDTAFSLLKSWENSSGYHLSSVPGRVSVPSHVERNP